jgi:TIR domain
MGAYDVFISYSHEDKPVADAACAVLERHAVRCWIAPRDVTLGMNYGESIMDAIAGARIMVLIFSDNANKSPQVEREIERAVSKGLWLIPIRIEDVVPRKSLEYFISSSHWLDAITPPMEQHLDRLAEAVRTALASVDKPSTPQAPGQLSRPPQRAAVTPPPAIGSKRNLLIALLVVLLVAVVGGGVVLHHVLSSKGTGAELVLTGATAPGANAFMPSAAPPTPPTDAQPAPTLQVHGDGTAVVTQPLPGDQDGLYGGTVNTAAMDRDKMITFLGANPAQSGAFVEALNADPTLYWSGGRLLTAADIPTYLRELTPALLRLDTRVTNHGFDGTHPTTLQSVFQAGTAVLVDAHGVPRARWNANPLTAPIALAGEPKLVGTPWPGYRPGALAEVRPSTATITNFVLVDVVTGQPFNRPAGTTGTNDTPHSQPVALPQPAPGTPQGPQPTPTTGQGSQLDIDGTYLLTFGNGTCGTQVGPAPLIGHTETVTITHQGNTLTFGGLTGTLNADGSFSVSLGTVTQRGVFATEGGRTVIRDGTYHADEGIGGYFCSAPLSATKQ